MEVETASLETSYEIKRGNSKYLYKKYKIQK